MENNIKGPTWKNRRRVIFLVLFFCAFVIGYITLNDGDSRVKETLVICAFTLAGSTIGFYVAGASWEGVNIAEIKSKNATSRYEIDKRDTSRHDTIVESDPSTIDTMEDGRDEEDINGKIT